MIKLVLCDLDGTLLTSNKEVSVQTKEAIHALRKKGILFGIATGRPYDGVSKKIIDWGIERDVDVIITMNGGGLWDNINKKLYNFFPLKAAWVKEIIETYLPHGFYPSVYRDNTVYTGKIEKPCARSAQNNNFNIVEVDPTTLWNDEQSKILFSIEEGKMPVIQALYEQNLSEHYRAFKTQSDLFEFVDKRISKSYGIDYFCNLHGITMSEVCVFGDTTNDIEMLKDCGIGVCMANGTDDAKEVSDVITKSNDDEGIAWYVHNELLK